jgi:hypothetical protein
VLTVVEPKEDESRREWRNCQCNQAVETLWAKHKIKIKRAEEYSRTYILNVGGNDC